MRQLLFSLGKLEIQGGGKALVVGRVCGDLMKAGDRAHFMVRLDKDENIVESEPIEVTIPELHVFNLTVGALEPGYVAGLIISDEMATGLRLGWYLKGENP